MTHFISVNGVRLAYEDGGHGTAIVTLHGGPGMSGRNSDWQTFQPLTDRYRLISYDQRGNNDSESLPPYSHEQFVEDLESLRQQLGLEKMVILGGSYGGFIALEYALKYQQHLHGVILRDTKAASKYEDGAKTRAINSGLPMDEALLDKLFAGQLESDEEFSRAFGMIQPLYNVNYDPVAGAARLAQIPFRYQTHNWAFSRNQPQYDLTASLNQIRVPVLVTVGRHDWITPLEASQEIASLIPNSQLQIFEHSGHSPQLEETALFLQVVRQFLNQVVPA